MKKMDKKNWLVLFVIMILSAGLLITVMPVSAASTSAPTVKENPYEHWIEAKDLKSCVILFSFDAIYSDSAYGDEDRFVDYQGITLENGEFNDSDNTFRVSNITEICEESGWFAIKGTLEKKCEITFDSGVNNILSFSASEVLAEDIIANKRTESQKSEISIKGSGSHFPLIKEISYLAETESGWGEIIDTKNTSYLLWEPKEMREYVKDIKVKETHRYKSDDKYSWTRELTSFKFDQEQDWGENIRLEIMFDGYLPRLRDSEGKCSSFGGKNDTGIDVKLRTEFYNDNLGKFGSVDFMTYKEFYKVEKVRQEFDKWMYERENFFGSYEKAGWEGTGLLLGPARLLDTENDYFCALRFHDDVTERYGDKGKPGHRDWWREQKIKVTNTANDISVIVAPVDWGPHVDTGRVIDLSEKAIKTLGAGTDTTIVKISIVDSGTPLGLVTN